MSDLHFAMIGAGFWSRFQLAGWQELAGAKCVAVCGLSRDKADELAFKFGIASVYDVTTVMMQMDEEVTVTCNMSYASRWEFDCFPQTMVAIEGTEGGVSLGADYELQNFDRDDSTSEQVSIPDYSWVDPAYELIHTSIVACQQNLLDHLRGVRAGEMTGEDNLRSLQLVFTAYKSKKEGAVVKIV